MLWEGGMAVGGEIGCGLVQVWHKIRFLERKKNRIDCAQ